MADNGNSPKQAQVEEPELREWMESFDSVVEDGGREVAGEILSQLRARAQVTGVDIPFTANTPYVNTHSRQPGSSLPRRPGTRTPNQEHHSLERAGNGCARES